MWSKARHPVTAGRRITDAIQQEHPGTVGAGIPLDLDHALEKELSAPCPYFRTSYVLVRESPSQFIDADTLALLKREIEKGKGGQRRKRA